MLRSLLCTAALLLPLICTAVEVNQASEAELDGVRGIGPGLSARILHARQQALFLDWADLMARVRGIGPTSATRLSREGLTVNGQPFHADRPASPASAR